MSRPDTPRTGHASVGMAEAAEEKGRDSALERRRHRDRRVGSHPGRRAGGGVAGQRCGLVKLEDPDTGAYPGTKVITPPAAALAGVTEEGSVRPDPRLQRPRTDAAPHPARVPGPARIRSGPRLVIRRVSPDDTVFVGDPSDLDNLVATDIVAVSLSPYFRQPGDVDTGARFSAPPPRR